MFNKKLKQEVKELKDRLEIVQNLYDLQSRELSRIHLKQINNEENKFAELDKLKGLINEVIDYVYGSGK